MRINISQDSIDFLLQFSQDMIKICDKMEADTEKMLNVYKNVAEQVGPHSERFNELISHIKKADDIARESFDELYYELNCTIQKMEDYLYYNASYPMTAAVSNDIKDRLNGEIIDRLNSEETKPIVKELYLEYENNIRITDYNYKDTAYYSSLSEGIKFSAIADIHNPQGKMSDYFHEVGHMMDDFAGNGHSWLSSDPEYLNCLKRDFESNVTKVMVDNNCEIDVAYDIISEMVCGYWNAGVSDIMGSLSECRCQGNYGHPRDYWKREDGTIEKEAFANMFEASIGDENKLALMKKYFPTAYSRFEYMIRNR